MRLLNRCQAGWWLAIVPLHRPRVSGVGCTKVLWRSTHKRTRVKFFYLKRFYSMVVGKSKPVSGIDLTFVVCVTLNIRLLVLFWGFVCGFVPIFGFRCRGMRIDWLLGVRRGRWNRAAQQLAITSMALRLWFFVERVRGKAWWDKAQANSAAEYGG